MAYPKCMVCGDADPTYLATDSEGLRLFVCASQNCQTYLTLNELFEAWLEFRPHAVGLSHEGSPWRRWGDAGTGITHAHIGEYHHQADSPLHRRTRRIGSPS